jgi:hypothetical protein
MRIGRFILWLVAFWLPAAMEQGFAQEFKAGVRPAAAPAKSEESGACRVGARVTDRQKRSGVVIEARGADCRVKLDDGSVRNYLGWMLAAEGGQGTKAANGGGLAGGPYNCLAAGGAAGTLQLVIKSASQYADRNGKTGAYSYDPKTRKIVFHSGPWAGYYGEKLGPGKIGIASRPGGYYGTVCDLK